MTTEISDHHSGSLLWALHRKHALTVLQTAAEPVTITQLTAEYGVPRTTCIKRLGELTDAGLLPVHGTTTASANGIHEEMYHRRAEQIEISFVGDLSVTVTTTDSDPVEIDAVTPPSTGQ